MKKVSIILSVTGVMLLIYLISHSPEFYSGTHDFSGAVKWSLYTLFLVIAALLYNKSYGIKE